ncbi:MAG: hypothetical protein ACREF3_16245 [Acetobacteraceae bacterium]
MRLVPVLLMFLGLMLAGLFGCSSLPSSSEQGFVDEAGWRHQQAVLDAQAIVQGMEQARAQSRRTVKQAQ